MRLRLGLCAAAVITVAAVVTTGFSRAEEALLDSSGRPIPVQARQRIVSIGGDVTEIIYALGLQAQIVAVDQTSQFPPEALKDKKDVGYVRALSAEGVLSTSPGLIVASKSAGPPDVVKALKSAAVPYVEISDAHDPSDVANKVRAVATAAGAVDKGEKLAQDVTQNFATLEVDRKRITKPQRGIFVLSVQKGVATIAGAGTSADAILKLAGVENAAQGFNGFKPMVDEALLEMQPDVIVVMKRSDPTHDALAPLAELKGVAGTPAGKAKRFIAMDALYLLGFGPRAPAAARDLMVAVYPELGAATATR